MSSKLETHQQTDDVSVNPDYKETDSYDPDAHNANIQQELWIQKQVSVL